MVGTVRISIEVAYAVAERAIIVDFTIATPACVADALRLAAADERFAGVDVSQATVGVYGRTVALDHPLQDGDRVEIYRPLAADPKDARRNRAREARKKR